MRWAQTSTVRKHQPSWLTLPDQTPDIVLDFVATCLVTLLLSCTNVSESAAAAELPLGASLMHEK
jgi:hypothetical protein